MADVNILTRLVAGYQRNVDLTQNALIVGSLKVGSTVTNTELTKAILDKLVLIQTNADSDGTFDTRYTKISNLAALTAGKGASLVGLQDAGSYFTTKNVEAALQQLGAAIGTGSASSISYNNSTSHLTATNVQTAIDQTVALANAAQTTASAAIPATQKGAANGVASLDSGGRVPVAQLPTAVLGDMQYQGTLAATGALPSGAQQGQYWVISTAGTFTSTTHAFAIGDWLVANGSGSAGDVAPGFDYIDNNNKVSSVNGLTGAVVLTTDQISEGTTNLYFTANRAKDAAGAALSTTATIALAYNSGTRVISASIVANSIDSTMITTTIADQSTILGGNGTPLNVAFAPGVRNNGMVAGQAFAQDTTYFVRMALTGETAGALYAADQDTTSAIKFHVVGTVRNPSAAVSAGGSTNLRMVGIHTLGANDTPFASGDIGKPVYLASGGGFSTTVPTTANYAVLKVAVVMTTTTMLLLGSELYGIN